MIQQTIKINVMHFNLLRRYCPHPKYTVSIMCGRYDHSFVVDDQLFWANPNREYTVMRFNLRDLRSNDIHSSQWLVLSDQMESVEALLLEHQKVTECIIFGEQISSMQGVKRGTE